MSTRLYSRAAGTTQLKVGGRRVSKNWRRSRSLAESSIKRSESLSSCAKGTCQHHHQRSYTTDNKGAANDAPKTAPPKSVPAGVGAGAGVKKVGGTSSTLSNLENLYAAFAKQQKEKAKINEEKAAAKDAAKRASEGDLSKGSSSSSPLGRDQVLHQAAMDLQLADGVTEGLRAERRSWLNTGLFSDELSEPANKSAKNWVQALDRRSPRAKNSEDGMTIADVGRVLNDSASPTIQSAREQLENRTPWTLAEIEETEEIRAVAEGRLDPTSPQALEAKRRAQPITPRSESEANSIEQSLLLKHRTAVEQVAHIEKDLDLSSTVPGMAPLTHSQNPYLYNEAYALGLTTSELTWLQTRKGWKALVDAKRTNIALQQRNMKEDREMVDDLFVRVVNTLTQGPQSEEWIHPEDLKAQQRAMEARTRLQKKMLEIYTHYPAQWAAMVLKYMPDPLVERTAAQVFDREFWNPSNPWLLAAFTKSVISEAEMIEKTMVENPLEAEIHARLVAQGLARDDDYTDEMSIGPLGEHDGLTAEEKNEEMERQEEAMANFGCLFCSSHRHAFPLEPMNVPLLARHMTTNGQILPRQATGLCKRHQAKLAKTIKQARHLNLFTHKKSEYRINNVFKPVQEWGTPDLDVPLYVDPFIAQRQAREATSDAWMNRMTRDIADYEMPESMRYTPGEHTHEMLQTWRMMREGEDDLLEDLNTPSVDPSVMNNIEELAGLMNQSDRRLSGADLPSEEAMQSARAKPDRSVDAVLAKTQAQTGGRRDRRSSSSLDDETDTIGDSMVKAALRKGAARRDPRAKVARKDRDTL